MSVCELEPPGSMATDMPPLPVAHDLTVPDKLLLEHLLAESQGSADLPQQKDQLSQEDLSQKLQAMNNSQSESFVPTVFLMWDLDDFPKGTTTRKLLDAYISWASGVARHPTDVVFITHLILYFCTTIPSAIYLYNNFTWVHGVLHAIMTGYYFGTYTLMRHNHIHGNGILSRPYRLFDTYFPYVLDPMMGHTWNSYYYHHVKHHHVEGNGPDDLSSTIRLQRDEWSSLAYYVGRFTLLIWLELPYYFFRTGKQRLGFNAAFWEFSSYAFLVLMSKLNLRPTIFVFLIPFSLIRLGLMIGNFGQHAFVDELEPDSDYRSSITLIDVPSNRYCFNDGYHTAHHLNPLRHWRDQPLSFLKGKTEYAKGRAIVFRNIDYLEITYRLMKKDYNHLARCFVPINEEQRKMSHTEVMEMLKRKTRRFSEEDIQRLWGPGVVEGKKQ